MRRNSLSQPANMKGFAAALILPMLVLLHPPRANAAEPVAILLWPHGVPGAEGKLSEGKSAVETVRVNENGEHIVSGIRQPSITPYLPDRGNATGAAVIIAPGGGHKELWMDHEGYAVAKWLSDHGVAAFILKYRLAREPGSSYTIEGTELSDIKRAVRLVRSRAAEWGLKSEHIGVMGFSAGGELAALASTRSDSGVPARRRPSRTREFETCVPGPDLPRDSPRHGSLQRNASCFSGMRRRRPARHRSRTAGTLPDTETSWGIGGTSRLRRSRPRLRDPAK